MSTPITHLPTTPPTEGLQETNRVGNVGGEQVQQVHGEPVALQQNNGGGHVDNAPLHQVQQQLGQVPLNQVQPQVNQQQVHERLMTFDQLSQNVGHRPHPDKLGGLWKMSEKYKAVEQSLNQVNNTLSGATLGSITRDQNSRAGLQNQLNQLVRDGESYIAKHTGLVYTSAGDKAKIAAMRAMVDQAKLALSVVNDPQVGALPHETTLTQALEMKQRGVLFKDCDFQNFTDDRIDHGRSNLNFGAGNANTVQKLVYGDGVGAQTLIFKPEPDVDRNPLLAQRTLGVDLNAPHYGERNIASRAVDQALGGSTVVNSRMVMHDGHVGLLMDKAGGNMPGERAKVPVTEQQQRFIDGQLNAPGRTMDEKVRGLKSMEFVEVGGQWMKIEPRYADPFEGVPPTPQEKASIQQQLCRLEWSDGLCGQFDRHGQNYLISIDRGTHTANVAGIDNDLAFGKNTHGIPPPGPDPTTGYNGIGKPLLIDRTTYDRIHNMDFARDLLPQLQGRIGESEIGATRERFNDLKGHAETLQQQGKVVDNWETWTSGTGQSATELLTDHPAPPPSTSYYSRDIHEFTA